MKKRIFYLVMLFILLAFIGTFIIYINFLEKNDAKTAANSSLKQLGNAMMEYALKHNGAFPSKGGVKGLEKLRNEFGYSSNMFTYRGSKYLPAKEGEPLTSDNVAFVYRGGLTVKTIRFKGKLVALAWDKPRNFDRYGTILFVDGQVKGFAGANWMDNIYPPPSPSVDRRSRTNQ